MLQLILVLLSIALTAAIVVASINYLPGWRANSETSYALTKSGFLTLESAFKAYSKAQGSSPVPTAASDGGISQYFQTYYAYLPKAPTGYDWKYGHNGTDYYFCLHSLGSTDEGTYRGMARLKLVWSAQQYFVVDGTGGTAACGNTVNLPNPSSFPANVATNYLVKYVPGMP